MKIIISSIIFAFSLISPAFAATIVPFTIAMSEAVNVTGSPRIAVDVGGVTRYATYASGTGTSSLTFTYAAQTGDVDLDGVTLSSPIDLNGGTITDLNGNPETNLTFTVPDTSGIKIDYPSLSMDFIADADGRYTLNGTAYNDLPAFLSATGGTFARNSVATYFDSAGVLQTASANQPRFDHDPVTHAPKGILIEESRTNFITQSQNLEHSAWVGFGGTRISGLTAPDGSGSGVIFTGPSPASVAARGGLIATNTAVTYSVHAKYISGSPTRSFLLRNGTTSTNFDWCLFNLQTGQVTSGCTGWTNQAVGNGWYRLSYTRSSGIAIGDALVVYVGTTGALLSADQWGVWGVQLEQGSFPTSYIPTTTAAVTRAADVLTVPTGSWFNSTRGTLFFSIIEKNSSGLHGWGGLGTPSTSANRTQIFSSTSGIRFQNFTSGVGSTMGLFPRMEGINKAAYALENNNFSYVANGGNVTLDNTQTLGTKTILTIGKPADYSSDILDGYVQKFKYYPARISNTQLQMMTQ